MRLFVAAALCAAQIASAAQAAGFEADRAVVGQQRGTFAGARLRVPFGGRDAGRARASLGFAAIDRTRFGSGAERLRFSEGVELGLRAHEPVELRLGGASVASRFSAIPEGEARRRQDKTGKVILKGVAVVAIVGVAVIGGLYLAIAVACDGNRCDD
ncbi:MAG: hypothetical protein ACJ8DZ_08005 [Allosphingosinicella sp.]